MQRSELGTKKDEVLFGIWKLQFRDVPGCRSVSVLCVRVAAYSAVPVRAERTLGDPSLASRGSRDRGSDAPARRRPRGSAAAGRADAVRPGEQVDLYLYVHNFLHCN